LSSSMGNFCSMELRTLGQFSCYKTMRPAVVAGAVNGKPQENASRGYAWEHDTVITSASGNVDWSTSSR
jgi:DNA/RNA endonuclease G (NUC1)